MFKIKYVGWCHVCKYSGPESDFICGCCPDVLITQFAAQTLSENMIQFEFMSAAPSTAFKKRNLVFTFPELSLPAVTFHWYDMSPWGQIYYVTGADAGAPELWNWITGNPGEITGFNVKVVSI